MTRFLRTIRRRPAVKAPGATLSERLDHAKSRDIARLYGTRIWL